MAVAGDGIAFEDFNQEWLEDVEGGNPSTTMLGHRFVRKLLAQ
jgi:hypothetical protein